MSRWQRDGRDGALFSGRVIGATAARIETGTSVDAAAAENSAGEHRAAVSMPSVTTRCLALRGPVPETVANPPMASYSDVEPSGSSRRGA